MKKTWITICIFLSCKIMFGQDYLTGKLRDEKSGTASTIYYDRTQLLLGSKVHQTLYKVLDEKKKNLYSIYVTHDQEKATISISINIEDSATKNRVIDYDRKKCGLIFSDAGDIDTAFAATQPYTYLLSFADTLRDYPVLHKINTLDQKEIDLDPLTKLRIRKHNGLVRKFYQSISSAAVAGNVKPNSINQANAQLTENTLAYSLFNDSLNSQLFALRDSLYSHNSHFIDIITKMREEIELDYPGYMKVAVSLNDEAQYGGDQKDGQPHGKGLLVSNGNIYDGIFGTGLFISGKAIIKTKTSTYYGECYRDSMDGMGWLKYVNGGFVLGEFKGGRFYDGISLAKENGEIFFGSMKNDQRTGYGELRNSRGDSYYGEFLNGRLVKGYTKEVDQFGYSTYSRIENGTKNTISARQAELFFDKIHIMKEKAEVQP